MLKRQKAILLVLLFVSLFQGIKSWCLKTQFADTAKINSIDFSRDGSKIVTASDSNLVIVWDAHTLQQLHVYNFTVKAYTAKFSKDNKLIAIGGARNSIHVLNVGGSYTPAGTFPTSQTQTEVFEVDFSQDSTKMVSCGKSNFANLYTVSGSTITYVDQTADRGSQISCCKILTDTPTVAYGTRGGTAYFQGYKNSAWLTNMGVGGLTTITSPDPGKQRRAVDWNIINQQAYFGGIDKTVQQVETGGTVKNDLTTKQIYTISVSRDSTYAAIGGQDGLVYLWNVVTKGSEIKNEFTLSEAGPNAVYASAFSPDGEYLATGDSTGMMFLYKRVCSGCPSGTYANASTCRSCNTDQPGCYICKNASYCYSCSNGYYIQTSTTTPVTKKCKPCISKIQGCNQCSNDSNCISCIQGYYLDTTSATANVCKPCWGVSKGCLMCNDSSTCQQCDFRYFLDSNKCVSCTNATKKNCLACNATDYCLQCVQGYYEDGSGGCTQCTKNCSYCVNGSFCTQCDNSFYLNNGVCSLCSKAGCLSCNSTDYCFDCMESMYETSGSCAFCTPPCLECSGSATSCQACIVGYYLSSTSCLSCTTLTGCVGCKGGGTTDCTACATGYYLTGGACSECKNLKSNCAQCNSTDCFVCRLGFYYDSTATECKKCSAGCLTCYDQNVCLSCQVGYYYTLSAKNCTLCPTQCSACESDTVCTSCNPQYYYNSTNKNCTKCSVTNCVTCKDEGTCLTCAQGFYIASSGTECKSCKLGITNCLDCYNTSYCKACQLGFYLVTGNASCSECASPCSTCDVGGCITCELGYYLNSNSPKSCSACPKSCLQCLTDTNCSKCVPGYYHDATTDKCMNCQNVKTGCSACNSSQCFSCKLQIGYFLDSSDSSCPLCSSKIPNCLNCLSESNCILCKYGYVLTSLNQTCSSCSSEISNCQHCLNTSKCHNCMRGFYLDGNGDCQRCVQGCSSCNDSATCEICLRQYVMQTDKSCALCENKLIGCEMCKYNPTVLQCTNCVTGYYLSSTTCTLCSIPMKGCSVCSDGSTCLTCSSGYYHDPTNDCFLCSSQITNCQLCDYDTVNSAVYCLDCNEGYFLTATKTCDACTDVACLGCSDSTTCTRCQTGFYLSSGDCLKCQNLFAGCRLCNSSQCLQCGSGFYLDGSNKCQPCSLQGCELCSQLNPTTKCLSCNSQYYLTVGQTCQLCKVPLPNCLQCSNGLTCQHCDSGYYLLSNQCDLCSNKFVGCSLCTPSVCLECQSGYLLDSATDSCELCNKYIPGCSFCLSESTCLSCQSGFFPENNVCKRCSTITGCLQCTSATQCIFCDYGYYLKDDKCHLCNTTIQNCIACASPVMCTACLGNYILSAGACAQLKGESFPNYTDIKLITEYVNQNLLKHTLQSIGKKIVQIDLNWIQQSKLFILDQNYTEIQLKILRTQFSPSGYSLVFYTDNPLGTMTDLNSLNGMPLISQSKYTSKRLLNDQQMLNQNYTPQRRLLNEFSMNNRFKTKMEMTEEGINSLFPNIHHSGNFYMKYKLSEPEFYRSVINQQTYYYHYFGYIVTVVLIILYLAKVIYIAPEADDKGEIIPHILCYKMMAFIIYPLYGQYLSYCKGFLLLDFPWMNALLSPALTIDSDTSPDSYKIFYENLNLPSTYLFALMVQLAVFGITFGVIKYVLKNETLWENLRGFFYNLFICGVTVGSFLALQGAYYNPVSSISINSIFYIIGISIFVAIILQSLYSIYKSINETIIPFHKPRVIIKCLALSLAYANPLYIFMSLLFLDICLIIIEYILKKDKKVVPKIWLFNNILVDIGLSLMMLGPYSLISVFIASACIIGVIGVDIFIMIKQNAEMRELRKVKLQQNELIKTMAAIEKEQISARSKNHQIYFKNKILQDLQAENISQEDNKFNSTNCFQTLQQTQNLFFQQNEQELKPGFQTIPIFEENSENLQDQQEIRRPQPKASKRKANLSPLRNRKKNEKKEWPLQDDNAGTFVLGQFK